MKIVSLVLLIGSIACSLYAAGNLLKAGSFRPELPEVESADPQIANSHRTIATMEALWNAAPYNKRAVWATIAAVLLGGLASIVSLCA